ncbi:MAG: type II toxin-antitoxin system PemK/MazF family toxin [Candidatus Methanoplasma sp.]|nr:type II toxin-antitoxin system PemK/MazF family toxin [Candidatus Methanoplasma sp.]
MSNLSKVPWSVWTARVKFEDSPEVKNRPVVVLKNDDNLCICSVLPITSKHKDKCDGYLISNLECVNLRKVSTVKLQYFEIEHDKLIKFLGMLDPADIYNLKISLQSGCYGSNFL